MKTKKSKTWFVSIIIFILFGLLSCKKETYPNKMDSIAKALSKIKKWDVVFTGFVKVSVSC